MVDGKTEDSEVNGSKHSSKFDLFFFRNVILVCCYHSQICGHCHISEILVTFIFMRQKLLFDKTLPHFVSMYTQPTR
jgi:hypothetical protein